MLFGVDVSHHQKPESLNWDAMRAAGCSFAIARACYGTMRDRVFPEHIRRARAAGMRVGAYLFFRPDQPLRDQFEQFAGAALVAGYGRPDDIVPALDFEDDTEKRPIRPSDSPNAEALALKLQVKFGVPPICYITQRDWGRAGKPAWVLSLPLWVAHYSAPSRKEPATPNGMPWAIWQHRVARFDPSGPSGYYPDPPQIDQNRANYLPLLSGERFTEMTHPVTASSPEREAPDEDGTENGMAALLLASIADRLSDERRSAALDELSDPLDEESTVAEPRRA
jgi:hypothetical protein